MHEATFAGIFAMLTLCSKIESKTFYSQSLKSEKHALSLNSAFSKSRSLASDFSLYGSPISVDFEGSAPTDFAMSTPNLVGAVGATYT